MNGRRFGNMLGKSFVGIRVLAIVVVVALALSCVPKLMNEPVVENAAAADGPYVQVGMISTVVYWNPLNIQMVEDYIVTYLVYSPLFAYDENWEGPVNDLATGYHQVVHPNGSMTTYINITTTAYFRGFDNIDDTSHPLDARDVSYTYNLIKNNSGGTFDWYLEELSYFTALEQVPGSGVWDQVSTWCEYEKATLIDDISATPILPMYLWGPDGENYENNALGGMDPDQQIGSGPFVFEDWERDSWYKFKTAPNYHGQSDYGAARTVDIPGVMYKVVSDAQAMCIEVNTGTLDCAVLTGELAAYDDVLGVDASVNVYKAAVAENGITDIAINAIPDSFDQGGGYLNRHPALLDPFVREAIAMTLNRDYIVNVMMGGLPIMAHSVVQPGYWQKDIENKVVYDPAGAKALLLANGWEDTDGDGWLEATDDAYGVQKGLFAEGTELSNIRCQAIETDDNYGKIAQAWPGWADDAGIQLIGTIETETTMVNKAWYAADYDIWVWHWGWGPEPIGGALSVWLTSEIEKSGDNCQMPMGPWWYGWDNYTDAPTTWNVDGEIIEYELEGPYSAFDQNISIAWKTLNMGERKVICDKLQQWVYDSYCELPPYYDLGLYGYNDYHFDNWGDWEAHNGLNVVQGLPWIWYLLEPVVDRKPFFNVEPETWYTAYEDVAETFSIKVSDEEGSPLWVNFTFGDGAVNDRQLTGDTTVPTWVNVSHTYTTAGELTLNVSLTDGFKEDDVVRYLYREATVEVQGAVNDPAEISSVTRNPLSPAYTDEVVTWVATASDPDSGDSGTGLKFTWDWDDGTYSVESHDSVANDVDVADTKTHSWSAPGTYHVVVSVFDETGSEDGEHNVSITPITYTIILNQAPTNPVVQPIFGLVDEPTECVATSSDADLENLVFTWEWDDGTFTVDTKIPEYAGQPQTSVVTHEWSAEGLYDITVWVADESGHNVSTEAVVNITSGNVPPGAIWFDWSPDPIYVGVNTTFNVSATDVNGDVVSFTVELGNGRTVTNTTEVGTTSRQYWEFQHTYDLEGSYTVNITVEDAELSSDLTLVIEVILPQENVPPELVILTSYLAYYGEPKTIRPLEAYDPNVEDEVTVWFDWGDGTPMSMGDPDDGYAAAHTYNETGSFTLTIYADDGEPEHNVSRTATVTVKERNTQATIERIAVEPDKDEYSTGEMLTFIVTVADLEGDNVTVRIEYGDGEDDEMIVKLVAKTDMNLTFEHAYDSSGSKVVNATVDDGFTHEDTELPVETITIEISKSSFPWALAIGGILGALIIIAAVAMLMKRKKKGPSDVPSDAGGMEGMAMAPPEEELPPSS
jgi:ABC-type transport system substrate-binding protein